LDAFARRLEPHLEALFAAPHAGASRLSEAMRYSLLAGGKRLRPFLLVACCKVCGGTEDDAMPAAVAFECVHTFSLVHDDLPAMDDDDLRRGKPTCHKVYGDGLATLAGDALLTLAFELLTGENIAPDVAKSLVRELAEAVGFNGMMAGQADDLAAEGRQLPIDAVRSIHSLKTARLFQAACAMGAVIAHADDDRREALTRYGYHLGIAFQIADDLLDVTSNTGAMGKAVDKDEAAGKLTDPGVVGIAASRAAAAEAARGAVQALEVFGPHADELRGLPEFVLARDH
jgi:geranylgeranyl pyrophosphate synthase